MAMTTTAAQIREAMEALRDHAADHFDRDDATPLLVCDGVSVDAFNEFVGDGEGLPIGVRFLELHADGRLMIVDFPTGVHETTADEFEYSFMRAVGNSHDIKSTGSITAHRAGYPHKEADATFGPQPDTPHRTPAPAGRTNQDWITLAVEVGRSQTWASLTGAAEWWYNYEGVQYVLLLKISATAKTLEYRLYDLNPIPFPRVVSLPAPAATGCVFEFLGGQPETVAFDARRILSIPVGRPLPTGVNDPITVDLRAVLNQVLRSL